LVWPRVGDVWEAPITPDVYLVVEIKRGYAWAVLLTAADAPLRQFHAMDGPIGSAWTRVVAGEEA
jgi:hypothetical protein